MKRVFAVLIIFALVFTTCEQPSDNNAIINDNNQTRTSLKISNQSSVSISGVKWQEMRYGDFSYGSSLTKNVSSGAGYIYFTKDDGNTDCRTRDSVVVSDGEEKEFVFTDATIVIDINDTENILTLVQMRMRETSITIRNESSMELNNVTWGSVNFGRFSSGTTVTKNVEVGTSVIYFTKLAGNMSCRTEDLLTIAIRERKEFVFTDQTRVIDTENTDNKTILSQINPWNTSLSIRNSSSFELIQVRWGTVEFMSNNLENSFSQGSLIKNDINEGSNYIFLKIRSKPRPVRSKEVFAISRNEEKEFIISDSLIVVDINNTSNEWTLSTLNNSPWTPAWTPPNTFREISNSGVTSPGIIYPASSGETYWFRVYLPAGRIYSLRFLDRTPTGSERSYADVMVDFYLQDGTVIRENVNDGLLGVSYTATISQYVYFRVKVVASGSDGFCVFYN